MMTRILSGLAMAGGILAVLLFTPWWGLGIVVFAALFAAAHEFQGMARGDDATRTDYGILVAACIAVVAFPVIQPHLAFYGHGAAMLVGFFILTIGRLARVAPIERSLERLSADGFGFLYIALTFPFVFLLRGGINLPAGEPDVGGYVLVLVMAVTFLGDTGGYLAGRTLGRHKLYPAVSPKKTIEGVMGGVVLGIAGAFGCRALCPGPVFEALTTVDFIIIGAGGALFGVTGDLVESMMKRAFGVKDSGTLIPGHGGALDRIDGLLFCGPFVWFYLKARGL